MRSLSAIRRLRRSGFVGRRNRSLPRRTHGLKAQSAESADALARCHGGRRWRSLSALRIAYRTAGSAPYAHDMEFLNEPPVRAVLK
jgi:hypothetical protein